MQKKVRERKRGTRKKNEKNSKRNWREISVTYQLTATVCDFILNIVRTKRLFKLFLDLDSRVKFFGSDQTNLIIFNLLLQRVSKYINNTFLFEN